jgi:Purple acid Phosphatase, N-terminal domain
MKKMSIASIALTMLLTVAAWGQANPQAVKITDGPKLKQTTDTTAEISWSTNVPGSSIVRYGTNPSALDQKAQEPWGGTKEPNGDYNHTVWLKNLQPNTTYHFTVESGQAQGTGTQTQSAPLQLHTTAPK